jgi:hypothetical protein
MAPNERGWATAITKFLEVWGFTFRKGVRDSTSDLMPPDQGLVISATALCKCTPPLSDACPISECGNLKSCGTFSMPRRWGGAPGVTRVLKGLGFSNSEWSAALNTFFASPIWQAGDRGTVATREEGPEGCPLISPALPQTTLSTVNLSMWRPSAPRSPTELPFQNAKHPQNNRVPTRPPQ